MYARTSKPQEGFPCKDSHAKCFKTTNERETLQTCGEVLRACFRHFLLCFHFIRNLQISTQESNANSTKISIYKTQLLTCNSEQKEKGRFFIKTLLQKCFKTTNVDTLHHSMIKE